MKILFILASDLIYKNENIFSLNNGFAPLSLTTLAAAIPDKYNAEIRIIDEGMQNINYDKLQYDIVAISCCASSSNRAYELSKYWQKRGAFTIIGGFHATLCPEEVSKHCDSVICGYGEYILPQVLEDYLNGAAKQIYNANCCNTAVNLEPRRDLIKHIPYFAKNTIYATRGCMNKCTYCSVGKFSNATHIKRPIDDIINEIKRNKFKKIYFLDSNLTADVEYAKELMSALIPLKISYYTDVAYDVYKNEELMSLLRKSGCFEVFIGFESLNEANLKSAEKNNIVSEYKNCTDAFHQSEIAITGSFMCGMDDDTEESILCMPEYITKLGIDIVRYALFTPIPGTELYKNFKQDNRLLVNNYDYYDFMHVVHKPKMIEPEVLQNLFLKIWKETYLIKNIFKRMSKSPNKHKMEIFLANMYFKMQENKIPKHIYL